MGAINNVLLGNVLENSTQAWQPVLSLLARHNVYFDTRLADQPATLEAAHALRYQVYCLERKFEKPEEHGTGLETDEYDGHAVQGVLFHRPTDRPIGTVRMILPENCAGEGLPIDQILRAEGIDLANYVQIEKCVEVSRFAISKEFRRRWTDDLMVASHPLARFGIEMLLSDFVREEIRLFDRTHIDLGMLVEVGTERRGACLRRADNEEIRNPGHEESPV